MFLQRHGSCRDTTMFDDSSRNTNGYREGGHTLGHDAARTNDGSVTDRDTIKNFRPASDPDVSSDLYSYSGLPLFPDRRVGIREDMVHRADDSMSRDPGVIANFQAAHSIQQTAILNGAMGADLHKAFLRNDLGIGQYS